MGNENNKDSKKIEKKYNDIENKKRSQSFSLPHNAIENIYHFDGINKQKEPIKKEIHSDFNINKKDKIKTNNTIFGKFADILFSKDIKIKESIGPNFLHEYFDENKNENKRHFKRRDTYSQLSIKKKNEIFEPNNCKILEKMNIFNSILIMIINTSYISEYFQKIEAKEIIDKCEKNNKPCLSSILYYLNECMWNYNNEKIYEQKLFEQYNNFINIFCQKDSKDLNNNLNLYDNKNVENIIEFIYNKINKELSSENKKKKKENKNEKDPELSKYQNDFLKTNKSKISDYFVGHFFYQQYCKKCEEICTAYNFNFNSKKVIKYGPLFYKLIFNIKEITHQKQKNILFLNIPNNNRQFTNKIDLINCFDYKYFYNIFKSNCPICKTNNYIKQSKIFVFPEILTIVINDNINYNFVLKDKIKLSQYGITQYGNKEYNLISILCSYFTKYICYCINHINGLWYSYTDGKIERVKKMDINSIPLIAIYQQNIEYKYNSIEIEDRDIYVKFEYSGKWNDLWFNRNTTIKAVTQTISKLINKDSTDIFLLINGIIPGEKQLLKEFINKEDNSLVFLVHCKND